MRLSHSKVASLALVCLLAVGAVASAEFDFASIPDVEPDITNWMSDPVTPIAHSVNKYVQYVNWIILPFLFIPQAILLIAMVLYRKKPGMVPAKFHENVPLEIFWTVVPVIALVAMAVPSYKIIKQIEEPPTGEEIVRINGHQFFWSYEYPEYGFTIANEPLVMPVGKDVVAEVTSVDVNHNWWVPAFGVKIDAIGGRINQLWFNVERTGWYKGQCAELCGDLHAAMLIDVYIVTEEEFEEWVAYQIAKNSGELPAEDDAAEEEPATAQTNLDESGDAA